MCFTVCCYNLSMSMVVFACHDIIWLKFLAGTYTTYIWFTPFLFYYQIWLKPHLSNTILLTFVCILVFEMTSMYWKAHTAKASKYVDIFFVGSNFVVFHPLDELVLIFWPLDSADMSLGWVMVTVKTAFIAGSSKHGNALLASVGSNGVTANHLQPKKIHI